MESPHAHVERQLRLEKQPPSPTYMTYVYQVPEQIVAPISRSASPCQPSTNETWDTIRLNDTTGCVYEHFHAPCNDHNKFLSKATPEDRYAYRYLPRMAPPPFDKSGRSSIRPQSASPARDRHVTPSRPSTAHTTHVDVSDLLTRNVTTTGAPCYSTSAVLDADLELGAPLCDPQSVGGDTWRRARVMTYDVPPSPVGYGEGGKRPFHQDYAHYKYFGFAGKGAKTSWAYNPKHSESWRATRSCKAQQQAPTGVPPREPGQPMTRLEAKLVAKFPQHGYPRPARPPIEILDPYMENASVVTRQPLTPQEAGDRSRRRDKVTVATYRQPVPGELTLAENPSPNHGSQSPFHQRYSHYKMHGFAGQGATSSWARNPKIALLYDP